MKQAYLKKCVLYALLAVTPALYADVDIPLLKKDSQEVTGNISLVSDYRFRGISQTMRRPAIQGGFDYKDESGLYLGTWASNVDGTTHFYNNTSLEWDFYGGFKNTFANPDIGYNIGLIRYYYPGGKAHTKKCVHYNTTEWYAELSYQWLSVRFWQTLTDFFGVNQNNTPYNWSKKRADRSHGDSRGSHYIEANVNFDLIENVGLGWLEAKKLSLQGHYGHQAVRHYKHLSYDDWRVTLTQEFKWLTGFISYVGTNARHSYYDIKDNSAHGSKRHLGRQAIVVGISKSF